MDIHELIKFLNDSELKIIENIEDDEGCHVLEEQMMVEFIKVAHLLKKEHILEAQGIFERVGNLDFCRWYA